MPDPFTAAAQSTRALAGIAQAVRPSPATAIIERIDKSERLAAYVAFVEAAARAGACIAQMRLFARLPWHQHVFGRWDPMIMRGLEALMDSNAAAIAAFHRLHMVAPEQVTDSARLVLETVAGLSDFVSRRRDDAAFLAQQEALGDGLREFDARARLDLKTDRPKGTWTRLWLNGWLWDRRQRQAAERLAESSTPRNAEIDSRSRVVRELPTRS